LWLLVQVWRLEIGEKREEAFSKREKGKRGESGREVEVEMEMEEEKEEEREKG